jgi:hypothetical protein
VPTPDGEVLLFVSDLDLTGQNSSNTPQVYRYDAGSEALLCISCDPGAAGGSSIGIGSEPGPGGIGGGSYDPPGQSAPMSASGEQIFFETENALVPEDRNSGSPPSILAGGELREEVPNDIDVYEWENGQIYLISSGRTGFTTLQGVTPSGNDVLFDTNVDLTKQTTGGYIGLYDARVGGGFPSVEAEAQVSCDDSENCHGASAPNPVFAAPASAILQGTDNTTSDTKTVTKPTKKVAPNKKRKKKKKKKKTTKKPRGKSGKSSKVKSHARGSHVDGQVGR